MLTFLLTRFSAVTEILNGCTFEADVVAAVAGEGGEDFLRVVLGAADVGGGLLEEDGEEGLDGLLDVDLFADREHLLEKLGDVLHRHRFAVA